MVLLITGGIVTLLGTFFMRCRLMLKRLFRYLKRSIPVLLWGNLCFSVLFLGLWGIVAYTPLGVYLAEVQSEATLFGELPDNVDAIVVLGGQSMRAADASKLYYAGKSDRIIVSADEEALLDVLLGANIPRNRIELDVSQSGPQTTRGQFCRCRELRSSRA